MTRSDKFLSVDKQPRSHILNNMLSKDSIYSIVYHDIFGYPLKKKELFYWRLDTKNIMLYADIKNVSLVAVGEFVILKGKKNYITKRLLNEKSSISKLKIAQKAAKVISLVPTIKAIAISGSLAMKNANEDSDIDLLIITKKNLLWTSRMLTYMLLKLVNIPFRSTNSSKHKDRLCLNIWLDEEKMQWNYTAKNEFTAHEIAQLIPLYSKDSIFEEFTQINDWVLNYWPNASQCLDLTMLQKRRSKLKTINGIFEVFLSKTIEPIMYKIQTVKMKSKITNEKVDKKYAIFHPIDMDMIVKKRLNVLRH